LLDEIRGSNGRSLVNFKGLLDQSTFPGQRNDFQSHRMLARHVSQELDLRSHGFSSGRRLARFPDRDCEQRARNPRSVGGPRLGIINAILIARVSVRKKGTTDDGRPQSTIPIALEPIR
jgi:hypothetical protein